MEFKNVIEKNKFSLVVSLPSNDLGMAKAALEGGAQVTACKLAMDGDAVILRMFNPADSAAQMRLRASFPTRAIQTDLRELADLGELAQQDGAFDFELAPKRIATLRLERE